MQIIDNKALVALVRTPERITSLIKQSKYLGPEGDFHEVVIKWGLINAQKLCELGVKNVPSPITRDYKWPGMYKPFLHQKDTASFLTLYRKAVCFTEQGTGKTGAAIWAAYYLMRMGQVKRVLVVCPLSIMQSAWQNDLFKLAMHRTCDIAHGSPKKRKEIVSSGAEFVIINYDGLEIIEKDIKEAKFDLIIIDEANAYKNAQTKRWKCLQRIVDSNIFMRLWLMTGTPAAQSPVDAYGLAKLVSPNKVPKFFSSWRERVMWRVSNFTWAPKPGAKKMVHAALQPAIRFTKDQCMDLPEMTFVTRDVPLTAQQKKYYKTMKEQLLIEAAGEEISAVNAGALFQKLLQVSCGAIYSDTKETIRFDAKERLSVIKEIIEETNNKVLVFVPFRNAIDMVSEFLNKNSITNAIINGGVSPKKRTDIFRRFQDSDNLKVLIIQPQAAAHGVTLTAADTVIWFGPTTSLETYMQANARVHRAGQKNATTVFNIKGSQIENRIYTMLQSKQNIHNQIVDLYKKEIEE